MYSKTGIEAAQDLITTARV